jgi:hypothetical protein
VAIEADRREASGGLDLKNAVPVSLVIRTGNQDSDLMEVENKGSLGRLAPGRRSDRVRNYRMGRVCSEPGCGTVLSIYNPSSRCAVHQRRADVIALRRLESEAVERSCAQCGALFLATNPRRKYCSSRCRSHAFAEREKLARRAAVLMTQACERTAA